MRAIIVAVVVTAACSGDGGEAETFDLPASREIPASGATPAPATTTEPEDDDELPAAGCGSVFAEGQPVDLPVAGGVRFVAPVELRALTASEAPWRAEIHPGEDGFGDGFVVLGFLDVSPEWVDEPSGIREMIGDRDFEVAETVEALGTSATGFTPLGATGAVVGSVLAAGTDEYHNFANGDTLWIFETPGGWILAHATRTAEAREFAIASLATLTFGGNGDPC